MIQNDIIAMEVSYRVHVKYIVLKILNHRECNASNITDTFRCYFGRKVYIKL